MPIPVYCAMTAFEMQNASKLPEHLALLDLPDCEQATSSDTIYVMTDQDLSIYPAILDKLASRTDTKLLLDFQRPNLADNNAFLTQLHQRRIPFCVSSIYTNHFDCAVLLPPVPLTKTIAEHIVPWKGRNLWLELALDGLCITVTPKGSQETYLPHPSINTEGLYDSNLHCHYHIEVTEQCAKFHLWRTKEDLQALLIDAEKCEISLAIGLWQELK